MGHPHVLTDSTVLSETELRFWIKRIMDDPAFGLCGDVEALRAFGREMGSDRSRLWRKAVGKEWIYPSEQRRYTTCIMRIRRGEIAYLDGFFRVLDPPQPPLKGIEATRWQFKVGGKLEHVSLPDERPSLPSVKGLFDRIVKWK